MENLKKLDVRFCSFCFLWVLLLMNIHCLEYTLSDFLNADGPPPKDEAAPPAVPQGFKAVASFPGQVTLNWVVQEGVSYDLFHSRDAGFELESGTKVSPVTSPHIHKGLMAGATYYYRLTAVNSWGASEPTGEISATIPGVQQISAGAGHTCGVVNNSAKCWGAGVSGRLGNNADSDAPTPRQVMGLASGVTQVSAAREHSCAVISGGAMCWGVGGNGRLGNNATDNKWVPVQVSGLQSGVTQISTGSFHTCAVARGGAKCWGEGGNGRLGHNESNGTASKSQPTQVNGLISGVTQISAGRSHTCALVAGGRALCWGRGIYGQLGNNSNSDANTPQQVMGLTAGVTQISAGGDHTCAVASGRALCWGRGVFSQLGNDANSNENTPQQVMGLTAGVTQISAGGEHTCAVAGGRALCWGEDDASRLGTGANSNADTPQQVHGLTSGVTQISAGVGSHTCAIMDGSALCWGEGESGQLGDGTKEERQTPVAVHDDLIN